MISRISDHRNLGISERAKILFSEILRFRDSEILVSQWKLIPLALLFLFALPAQQAFAQCTNPAGEAGATVYNSTYNVPQYCDGINWIAFGPPNTGAGSGGCSLPNGPEGALIYSSAYGTLQYCDGSAWRQVGKAPYGPAAPTNGLVGHWKLDETGGTTTAYDSSINSYNGAMQGGLSGADTAEGVVGTALMFDGNNDFINVGDHTAHDFVEANSAFTISAWIFLNGIDSYNAILSKYDHTTNNNGYWFGLENGEVQLGASENGVWAGTLALNSDTTLSLGQWYHVATTVNVGTDEYRIFVNGQEAPSSFAGGQPTSLTDIFDADTELLIGSSSGGTVDFFDGFIDDVRIYDRALSAQEIADLHAATGCSNPEGPEGALLYNDAGGPGQEITVEQATPLGTSSGGNNDSASASFATLPLEGSAIIVTAIGRHSSASGGSVFTMSSVTDNQGNTYELVATGGSGFGNAPSNNYGLRAYIYAAYDIDEPSGTFTITANSSTTNDYMIASAIEVSGLAASSVVDQTGEFACSSDGPCQGTTSSTLTASGSTSEGNQLAVAAFLIEQVVGLSVTTGDWTEWDGASTGLSLAYNILSEPETPSISWSHDTITSADRGSGALATFRGSGTGGAGVMQYCNGSEWVAIGKGGASSASVGGPVETPPVIESFQATSGGGTASDSITLTAPAGITAGDLLLIIVGNEDDTNTAQFSNNLAGWNFIGTSGNSNADAHIGAFWREATGGEGNVTVNAQSSDQIFGWYIRISGADTANPINVSNFTQSSSNQSTHNIPEVTTTVDNTLAIYGLSFDGGDGDPFSVSGAGWVEQDEQEAGTSGFNGASGAWGTKEMPEAGGTGTAGVTASTSDGAAYFQLAIQPPQ